MSPAWLVLLGGLTGLHAATWGAFKDSPFEGFHRASFARSVLLGLAAGALLAALAPRPATTPVLVLVGLLYAAERLVTEAWKAFLREGSQAPYAIPMRLAVRGRTVDARLPRYLTGVVVASLLVSLAVLVDAAVPARPPLLVLVLVGSVGGWLTAVGGAWKDAPVEGFSGAKFLRSPAVATGWVLVLLPLTTSPVALTVAAGGLSVLVVETWKTFLTGGRPPGKFAGRPRPHAVDLCRQRCRVLHCLAYGALAVVVGGSVLTAALLTGGLAVAMLLSGDSNAAPARAAAQEPDVDAALRREST